eukprot:COSAG02_NODE_61575_length_268_cov_0.615385_1_plen_89_part_11
MPPLGDDVAAIEKRFDRHNFKRPVIDPYKGMESVIRPTEGYTDLIAGIISVLNNLKGIRVVDTDENLFFIELVVLVHEMLLFGMLDRTP